VRITGRSFRSTSFSSYSNVLNDDDDVVDEELTRLREYTQGTIKAKTYPDQSSTTRPVTFRDNPSQAQAQAREQEEWQGDEEEQGEGQKEAEELAREEPASEPENDKATGSERPRSNRLQEEIAALRRSTLHWAKFEYLTEQVTFPGFEKDGKRVLDESQCVRFYNVGTGPSSQHIATSRPYLNKPTIIPLFNLSSTMY
jgi:hypothetical protein